MRPRVFIGSSSESERFALAIKARLEKVAECTPWSAGFVLSKGTMDELMRHARESDFGVFVFSADDVTTMRGSLLNVPRDNVIFEAGLFTGHLGPERCFIAVPSKTRVHLPTDLSGMTVGFYEDDRDDGNLQSAVSTFADHVSQLAQTEGLFRGTPFEQLNDLLTRFECSNWIKEELMRVERKRQLATEIEALFKFQPPNKARLLARRTPGAIVALLIAIQLRPQLPDLKYIKQLRITEAPHGFTRNKLFETLGKLKSVGLSVDELRERQEWLRTAHDLTTEDKASIDALSR